MIRHIETLVAMQYLQFIRLHLSFIEVYIYIYIYIYIIKIPRCERKLFMLLDIVYLMSYVMFNDIYIYIYIYILYIYIIQHHNSFMR